MNQENKICQNCKNQFVIEPDDFKFYEKMRVPAPTFCPSCRFQRRLMFTNERSFYKRDCDLCGKSMIAMYAPDSPYKVYCPPCWWSDKWDGLEYGVDYDPKRNFFEQFRDLILKTPHIGLSVEYPSLVNSDYINNAAHIKNSYLIYWADYCENVLYSSILAKNKDCVDSTIIKESELCYGNINCSKCYKTHFSEDCDDCIEVYFSKNCTGISHCFGCMNLRNKQYYIFNQPYTKEEYEKKIKEFKLDSFHNFVDMQERVFSFWKTIPHKFMNERHNFKVSGDYIISSKNATQSYLIWGVENGKFCQFMTLPGTKDAYDYTGWGNNAELIYESAVVGENVRNMKFNYSCWPNSFDIEYSYMCVSSSNLFGSANLKKKSNCIFNKQYSKDEFEKLKARIITDMNAHPYIDLKGRSFGYGEFFPYEFAPCSYNESMAFDYIPITKKEALDSGFTWRERPLPSHKVTKKLEDIPDGIIDVPDSIVDEVFECSDCKRPWRVVSAELILLRQFGLPVPRKCPDCRYRDRMTRVSKVRFYNRNCSKCGREVLTSYSPDRPEIIYCGECYQKEFI